MPKLIRSNRPGKKLLHGEYFELLIDNFFALIKDFFIALPFFSLTQLPILSILPSPLLWDATNDKSTTNKCCLFRVDKVIVCVKTRTPFRLGIVVSRRSSRGEVRTRNALLLSWIIEAQHKRNSFRHKTLGLRTIFAGNDIHRTLRNSFLKTARIHCIHQETGKIVKPLRP
jgi:hypothetical protein